MTLTACGIRPTPVLTGAEAPTVSSHEVVVYLVKPERDGLTRRTRTYTGPVDTTTGTNLLLGGLTDEEKKLGLVSEVPTTSSRAVAVLNLVVLPEEVAQQLSSKWGIVQVYCTARASNANVAEVKIPDDFCP